MSETDSFHRTLDAALAKGRLVSTRDALAQAIRIVDGNHDLGAAALADALVDGGHVVDVTTLADDALVERIRPHFEAVLGGPDVLGVTTQRLLRALAAAVTEPRP